MPEGVTDLLGKMIVVSENKGVAEFVVTTLMLVDHPDLGRMQPLPCGYVIVMVLYLVEIDIHA